MSVSLRNSSWTLQDGIIRIDLDPIPVITRSTYIDLDELESRPISETIRMMAREANEEDDRGETEPYPE